MTTEENTFGAVMIKLVTSTAKGREAELRSKLLDIANKNQNCLDRKLANRCECNIIGIISTVGFFDYMILLRTSSIRDIENFVIYCVRDGLIGEYIAETQTIAGALIYLPPTLQAK